MRAANHADIFVRPGLFSDPLHQFTGVLLVTETETKSAFIRRSAVASGVSHHQGITVTNKGIGTDAWAITAGPQDLVGFTVISWSQVAAHVGCQHKYGWKSSGWFSVTHIIGGQVVVERNSGTIAHADIGGLFTETLVIGTAVTLIIKRPAELFDMVVRTTAAGSAQCCQEH